MAISHKVKFTQCVVFDPARHASGNLPQCAFCHHKFDTWHALKQHIQRLNCPILMQQVGLTGAVATGASLEVRPSVAGKQPGHEDPDIQACIGENAWMESSARLTACPALSSCNRWIKDPTALKRHLKQTHRDLWDFVAPSSRLSVLRLSTNSPERVHDPGAKGPRIVDTIISAMSFSKAHS